MGSADPSSLVEINGHKILWKPGNIETEPVSLPSTQEHYLLLRCLFLSTLNFTTSYKFSFRKDVMIFLLNRFIRTQKGQESCYVTDRLFS